MRSFWTSEAVGAGRAVGGADGGASGCEGVGCRGVNAAASARGQADSVAGGGITFRGATGTGAGAKRLLKALEGPERSTAGAVVDPLGSRRLFTRAINSWG